MQLTQHGHCQVHLRTTWQRYTNLKDIYCSGSTFVVSNHWMFFKCQAVHALCLLPYQFTSSFLCWQLSSHYCSCILVVWMILQVRHESVNTPVRHTSVNTPSSHERHVVRTWLAVYRGSQEERTKLRESVPYVKLYRYNPKHLYPKLNGYGDNGQRKVWTSCISM